MASSDIRFVENVTATLGEGPLWSQHDSALYWVDTMQSKLMRLRAPYTNAEVRDLPYRPSCLAAIGRDHLFVVYKKGVGLFRFESGEAKQLPLSGVSFENEIFNDGICDRHGRMWVGTRDRDVKEPRGSLYSIGPDLNATKHSSGFIVSNGIAISPDNKTLYHTDSRPGQIDAYNFDSARGALSNRRIFLDYRDQHGHPDGCTVDSEGCVWVAEVGAGRVVRYTPAGKVDREIKTPVIKPTSVMFGGDNMSTLFITSMRYGVSEQDLAAMPQSGKLMMIDVGIRGLPEPDFVISPAHVANAKAPLPRGEPRKREMST